MRKNLAFWLVLAVLAVALVASAMLFVDYVRPGPVYCGAEGGCGAVKRTVWAHPLGVPMPLVGLAGFLAIAVAQMIPGKRARIAQAMLAVFGGIVALVLVGVQISMKTICPFCAVADGASILLAALSILRAMRGWEPPESRRQLALGAAPLALAVAVPIGVGMKLRAIPSDVPDVIAAEMKKTGPGKVTVVDFVDFECPFCRRTHAALTPVLESRKDKVRVVRKHVPLALHEHALDAAKAACCGEAQGKREEMAEALFVAPTAELGREGCEQIASKLGLDVAAFKQCVDDPKTTARIKADTADFKAAKGRGLPTLFVDGARLVGEQDHESLTTAIDGAIRAL